MKKKRNSRKIWSNCFKCFGASLLLFIFYFLIYTQVFGFKTPKRIQLEQKYERTLIRKEIVEHKRKELYNSLIYLKERDNNVYRKVFGIGDSLSVEHIVDNFNLSKKLNEEILFSMVYLQSLSYDTISSLAKNINNMASCVPSIPPVNLSHIRISSLFGVRADPLEGEAKVHMGIDLAGAKGEPIYVTGDGKVEKVSFNFFGYGNEVIVNHGFGYKTRYAHMQQPLVHVGQYLKRGDLIGLMGTSGKSTGSHLHYEVIYMDRRVNPIIYFNKNLSESEYERLVNGN